MLLLLQKSVTLNDLERLVAVILRYFAEFVLYRAPTVTSTRGEHGENIEAGLLYTGTVGTCLEVLRA